MPELSPTNRVEQAYERIAEVDRPEIWIDLRPRADVIADAHRIEQRFDAGERLPLAGAILAVKDNIDVAGLPTTAACPSFRYLPTADAASVASCRAAGAVVLGKTNLDQFATGLVGTRTPYGAVRDARDPGRIAGGSSSGSAVAVALGIADLALGTDTAGSGRVPAAFQGIVGLKPSIGTVSTLGVVPACPTFDCVSVFAPSAHAALCALPVLAAASVGDPSRRRWPLDAPLGAPPRPRIAIPRDLELSTAATEAWSSTVARLQTGGAEIVTVDVEPLLAAGRLLYEGAFVAERFAAVGGFIVKHPGEVDPVVAEIILGARQISAAEYLADRQRLDRCRLTATGALAGCDALLMPTTPFQPTIDDVARDPLGTNRRLGIYTTFCNLLDMCAIAVPAGQADGGQFGVTLFAAAFQDLIIGDIATRFLGEKDADAAAPPTAMVELFVLGAHMRGEPLNRELTARGGRFMRPARTASRYRLHRLATTPPKPGLERVESRAGAAIEGELWALPPAGLAALLESLPSPMTLGSVSLEDDRTAVGFLCEPVALVRAEDITRYGGWRAYLRQCGVQTPTS